MSRTLQVSPERHGAYPTIGDALAVAPRGSVVIVAPGAYIESLELTGFVVTIAAADGGEVLVTGGNRYAPTLASRDGDVTLRGITIRAADAPAVLVEGGELTMEHCTISAGFGAGVRLADGAGFAISDCTITGAQQGIVIEDATGTIDTTVVRDSVDDGIVVRLGADPTLRNCTIVSCGHRGVYIYQSGKPILEGCDISETGDEGIAVAQNSAPVLRRCYVHDTQGVGISFGPGTSGEVDSCKIENTAQPDLDIDPGAAVTVTKAAAAAAAGIGAADEVKGDAERVEKLLSDLDAMVGLGSVKAEVKAMIDEIQVNEWRRTAGLNVGGMSHHLIFAGAPGTGKTTVGRIYGQLLAALGVLPGGPFKEVSRRDLVGQYIGHTAEKTASVFDECRGGVLFLDEAYALTRKAAAGGDFGQEAVDTIVKMMEDHRNDIAVIAAGYTTEMQEFLDANPGLASRFVKTIVFENYAADELSLIVSRMVTAGDYTLAPEAEPALLEHFATVEREENFGNARDARKLFEAMRKSQSQRLRTLGKMPDLDQLRMLTLQDVQAALGRR